MSELDNHSMIPEIEHTQCIEHQLYFNMSENLDVPYVGHQSTTQTNKITQDNYDDDNENGFTTSGESNNIILVIIVIFVSIFYCIFASGYALIGGCSGCCYANGLLCHYSRNSQLIPEVDGAITIVTDGNPFFSVCRLISDLFGGICFIIHYIFFVVFGALAYIFYILNLGPLWLLSLLNPDQYRDNYQNSKFSIKNYYDDYDKKLKEEKLSNR